MEKLGNVYISLTGKSERQRPPGRLRHRWEENIKYLLMVPLLK
jgi:hypothetical protein